MGQRAKVSWTSYRFFNNQVFAELLNNLTPNHYGQYVYAT